MQDPSNKVMAHLMSAAADGRDDDVKSWIESYGAALINHKDFYGWTALMAAAREGRTSTIAILLDFGADPSLKDDHGKTAADYARKMNYHAIAENLDKAQSEIIQKRARAQETEEREAVKKQVNNLQKNAPEFKLKKR